MLARAGCTPADFVAALEACDLTVRWIDDESESVRELAEGLPADGYVNFICTRSERR